jgi:two-component system NarL family sensor kinase
MLDDLGLGPAIQSLTDDFSTRTGIETQFETVVFRGRLDRESRLALYRIAQEALTNIERHSGATEVKVNLRGTRRGAILKIADNGRGMEWPVPARRTKGGLGMRNMLERLEQLDGTLTVTSDDSGTTIEAQVPLTHMLAPISRRTDDKRTHSQ